MVDEAPEPMKKTMIRVREFDVARDLRAVEELERLCQVGLSGDQSSDDSDPAAADHDGGGAGKKKKRRSSKKKKKRGMSLYVEQIGDPFARVRHAPDHVILVILLYILRGTYYCTLPAAAIDASVSLTLSAHDSDAHGVHVCLCCFRLPSTVRTKRSSE